MWLSKSFITLIIILVSIVYCSFPFYDLIKYPVMIYGFPSISDPLLVQIAWWGSFGHKAVSVVKNARIVCKKCKQDNKDPADTSCDESVADLAYSAIDLVVTGAIGYVSGWGANGSGNGDGQHQDHAKRGLTKDSENLKIGEPLVSGSNWTVVNYSIDETPPNGVFDHWNATVSDLNNGKHMMVQHIDRGSGSGALRLHQTPITDHPLANATTNHLMKREDHLFPLCTDYIEVEYCANQNDFGGIYKSNELSASIKEIVQTATTDDWSTDFFKIYGNFQGSSNDVWMISMRLKLASDYDVFYWSECDTGS